MHIKPEWEQMLEHTKQLRIKSTNAPRPPFKFHWEEIGPGYAYGPAFGHWDIVHACMDTMHYMYDHALAQMRNLINLQAPDGMLPGTIWMAEGRDRNIPYELSHPPVWPFAVDDMHALSGDSGIIEEFYDPLLLQINWFENNRKAEGEGFYYYDIFVNRWESGVDESIRFKETKTGAFACVDASSHVYGLYTHAVKWGALLGRDVSGLKQKADALGRFIRDGLFDSETGFFFDIWAVGGEKKMTFDGMWPVVVGAATHGQAMRVIDENLLNPDRFFSPHPIATVGVYDPEYEPRMWRGPAWNSMTYWAARGCAAYGRSDAVARLLERALDQSSRVFRETGVIWEYYDAMGGSPTSLARKPALQHNTPFNEYLGHNPFYAMAVLFCVHKKIQSVIT